MNKFSLDELEILNNLEDDRLRNSLRFIREAVENIWSAEAPRIIHDYTDHGILHSNRIIRKYLTELLSANKGKELSTYETYVLVAGVYLHDIGMQCDISKFSEIKQRAEEFGAKFDLEFTAKSASAYSIEEQKEIRKNHHYLTAAWIDYLYRKKEGILGSAIQTIPDTLVTDVMDVCKYHSKLLIADCPYEFKTYKNERKRLIAALLRLADELDIEANRVRIETVRIFRLDPENSLYWWLHNATTVSIVGSSLKLSVELHPKDAEEFGDVIYSIFINKFKDKNRSVFSILKQNDVQMELSAYSDVEENEYREQLPSEITDMLLKEQKAKIYKGSDNASRNPDKPVDGSSAASWKTLSEISSDLERKPQFGKYFPSPLKLGKITWPRNRTVITGLGVISPNGIGKQKFWEALMEGKSGIKRISRFDVSSYPTQIAGQITDFDPTEYMSSKDIKRASLAEQFALASTNMALTDSNLSSNEIITAGVVIGSSGLMVDMIESLTLAFRSGISRVSPFGVIATIPSSIASRVSITYGLRGYSLTVSSSDAGLDALGYGFNRISYNEDTIIIVGSTDSTITPFGLALYCAPRIMSTKNDEPEKASRPFDKSRDGGVLSEGSGILILEELSHALARGSHIYAEVIGYANSSDGIAYYMPETQDTGIERSMYLALRDANITPNDIDYICAHAPSDVFDRFETIAVKRIFGEYAYKIPMSSIKSMIGNPLSAAGALQVIASVMVFENSIIPPTINHEFPDVDCDLDYVPNKTRKCENINTILINSHGFGGCNSSLIIKRYNA